jgi:2-octaprenylphenol hydroxylase
VAALLATGRCADRLRVHVLEARPLPPWRGDTTDLRVYALSRASQLLFEHLGVWRHIAAARACAYRRMHVWEGDDPRTGALEFDSADIGEPDLGHIVEDSLLRAALVDVLARASNAKITIGATIDSIEVEKRVAAVHLANGGAVHGAAVIAADGSDSAVRRLLDLPVVARSYGQMALVTHVASTQPHQFTAWQRFLPGGPLALLPLTDGRSSIVWSMPTAEAECLLGAAEAEFLAALTAASANVLGALGHGAERAAFPLHAQHALRYCVQRVALVGDAAHTVHPLAGQGMNLGLLDATCIAGVIEDAVLAGEDAGDLKVLGRYERKRKGANLQMLAALDGLDRLFRLPAWAAPLRRAGLGTMNATGPAKRLLMQHALGLGAGSENRLRWSHAERQTQK